MRHGLFMWSQLIETARNQDKAELEAPVERRTRQAQPLHDYFMAAYSFDVVIEQQPSGLGVPWPRRSRKLANNICQESANIAWPGFDRGPAWTAGDVAPTERVLLAKIFQGRLDQVYLVALVPPAQDAVLPGSAPV
jgi:hypothetical protein